MTQNSKLRSYLLDRPNQWVAMPELAKVITPTGIGAACHSRIADCRKKFEMDIRHRNERVDGVYHSYYMFVPSFKLEMEVA